MGALGVIDSGVGGLTVVAELRRRLPSESLLYFGDTARLPYGDKSAQSVRQYSLECADFLVSQGVKALVVACNTMTAHALEPLQEIYTIPIIGVVEPAVELACLSSSTGRIGVISTRLTMASSIYPRLIAVRRKDAVVCSASCPLFVPLAEEACWDHPAAEALAMDYLQPIREAGCDTLILGCTHYPLLRAAIQKAVGEHVTLIDSAASCVKYIERMLVNEGLARSNHKDECYFFVSDDPERFARVGSLFLGEPLTNVMLAKPRSLNTTELLEAANFAF